VAVTTGVDAATKGRQRGRVGGERPKTAQERQSSPATEHAAAVAADGATASASSDAHGHLQAGSAGSSSDDVSKVRGVGPKRASQLRAAGLSSVGALGKLSVEDAEAIAKMQGLPLKTLLRFRETAREMISC